jgi:hypothetical protein
MHESQAFYSSVPRAMGLDSAGSLDTSIATASLAFSAGVKQSARRQPDSSTSDNETKRPAAPKRSHRLPFLILCLLFIEALKLPLCQAVHFDMVACWRLLNLQLIKLVFLLSTLTMVEDGICFSPAELVLLF